MEWTEQHDNCLCQEILVLEPFKFKKGSIARGQTWEKIANILNDLELPRFRVTKRAVRERYSLLSEKFKAKMKQEEKASGIETDLSQVEKGLEEIAEKETAAGEAIENDKKKADNTKAVEMRNRALESLGASQKRKQNEEEENGARKSKNRRSGGDTVAYLREKNEIVQKWRSEELQLQKQRVEVESKKEQQSKKQHEDMMQIMLHQTKQQQENMQSFQQMFVSNYHEASGKTKLTLPDFEQYYVKVCLVCYVGVMLFCALAFNRYLRQVLCFKIFSRSKNFLYQFDFSLYCIHCHQVKLKSS